MTEFGYTQQNSVDLIDALHNASLFMAPVKEQRTGLVGVRFEYTDDKLTLVASDAYQLIFQTIDAKIGSSVSHTFLLPRAEVTTLLRSHSSVGNGSLQINMADNMLTVTGKTITVHRVDVESSFPQWRALVPQDSGALDSIGFSPEHLARLAKVRTERSRGRHKVAELVELQFHGIRSNGVPKPATVHFANGPTVITMPVKLSS